MANKLTSQELLNEEISFGDWKIKVVEDGAGKRFVILRHKNDSEIIALEDLLMFLFPFVDEKRQEQMIPVKTHRSRILFQKLQIKAHKDIKKGELINFLNKISVPEEMITVRNKNILIPQGAIQNL